MSKKVLIVLTSHDRLGDTGKATGFWLEELAVPYHRFKEAGFDITLASPEGGRPPVDPGSASEFQNNEATRRFVEDPQAQERLSATARLVDIDVSEYDAVFYPGGHGPLWDLVNDKASIKVIEQAWSAGKPVAAVCHGPIALVNAKDASGQPIVRDRDVAGFSNSEEAAVGLTDVVPLSVEDELKAHGGNYAKADDFAPFAVRDGQLITGQNPASSNRVAELLIAALQD